MKLDITYINANAPDFDKVLSQATAWETVSDNDVNSVVQDIIHQVRAHGDQALIEMSNKFDRVAYQSATDFTVKKARLKEAFESLPDDQKEALKIAAQRVRDYHEKQKQDSWQYTEADGTVLGQKVTPLDRAGLYVPGGKASYPSSVIMNAIPAHVAGVEEIVMVCPTPDGVINEMVFAAAYVAGVDTVFTIGGAQAVAALAYGTETVPQVDKIVGPGNIFVATAKRAVFGQVGIDMIAGPSEILVICDGKTDPDWIAMDLFSQAEHDEDAQAILVCQDGEYMKQVHASMEKLADEMERSEIIKKSVEDRTLFIEVSDLEQGIDISNKIAPEHLELSFEDADKAVAKIKHAGAIFVGRYTPEALGDYCAGPNHVLPTSGTARFSSPLGVYDFQKRSSIINVSQAGASKLGKVASVLARGESLTAHARSAEYRIK